MPHLLETSRPVLRPFTLEDIDAAYVTLEGHPDVWKFDPGFERTREQREAIIARYAAGNEEDGCGTLAVIHKQSQALMVKAEVFVVWNNSSTLLTFNQRRGRKDTNTPSSPLPRPNERA